MEKKTKQSLSRKRLVDAEQKMMEMDAEDMAFNLKAVTLFALKSSLSVALEDNVFKGDDEEKAKELIKRLRVRIELMKTEQKKGRAEPSL